MRDKTAKVAVLIPTYAPGAYIENCFRSISQQSLVKDSFCVYVALNGEEHPYRAFVEELLLNFDFHYKFFYLNLPGVSNARNFLIENSSEPYICFVDDDDILSSNFLESLLSVSSESVVGITDVQVFKYNANDSEKNYIGNSYNKLSSVEPSKFKTRKYFSSACAKLINRKMICNTRFDINLSKGEDALFMAQLSHRVHQVRKAEPEACYYVYLRPGSATRSKISKTPEIKRIFYVLKQYSRLLGDQRYEKKFLATRILATLSHLKKLFSLN